VTLPFDKESPIREGEEGRNGSVQVQSCRKEKRRSILQGSEIDASGESVKKIGGTEKSISAAQGREAPCSEDDLHPLK